MIKKYIQNNKGQISVITTLITAGGLIVSSIFASWFTANNRVGTVEKNVAVVEEREKNHYGEIQLQLAKINGNLEKISDRLGIIKVKNDGTK